MNMCNYTLDDKTKINNRNTTYTNGNNNNNNNNIDNNNNNNNDNNKNNINEQENILKCFLLKYLLFASQLKIIRKYDKK
ncbi:hypothetical protein PFMALIP_02553 [Plasmodium falciparum MaliPS096_E11]|uniref:Uncharacterized protein n=1 Tax=Plasmodium falciparum MaliPS096_E11 TaxID=1036727 RepID=A0A024WRP9_PLAFA|nr:hypothetical protein PFMALIP_02553 [Plasmodium falciparum MaliPS096_E11]